MSKIVVVSYVMETTLGEFQVLVRKKILKNALKRFLCRVSRPEVLCEKSVAQNIAKIIEKHLCRSLFLI